jgi:hypothetical protein
MIRNQSTKICSPNERDCYEKAHNDFLIQKDFCKCFEPCSNIKYEFEVINLELIRSRENKISTELKARIRFNSQFFLQFFRKQQFNILNFISFVGGILGLFAGFSAISFIELIYWFTVRVVLLNFGRRNREIRPIDVNLHDHENGISLMKYFKNFFDESSIHGLKYVSGFTKIDRYEI